MCILCAIQCHVYLTSLITLPSSDKSVANAMYLILLLKKRTRQVIFMFCLAWCCVEKTNFPQNLLTRYGCTDTAGKSPAVRTSYLASWKNSRHPGQDRYYIEKEKGLLWTPYVGGVVMLNCHAICAPWACTRTDPMIPYHIMIT